MRRQDDLGLGAGYWWSEAAEGASLFVRYGWVASVTSSRVKMAAEPPLYRATTGPCNSVEHGRRIVERILAVRLCQGTPERRAFREQLRRERALRLVHLPPQPAEDDEDWLNP